MEENMDKVNGNMILIKKALNQLKCSKHNKKATPFRVQNNYEVKFNSCCKSFEDEIRETIRMVTSSFNH